MKQMKKVRCSRFCLVALALLNIGSYTHVREIIPLIDKMRIPGRVHEDTCMDKQCMLSTQHGAHNAKFMIAIDYNLS